jgi:N-acetylglucosamine-6-sulfatase
MIDVKQKYAIVVLLVVILGAGLTAFLLRRNSPAVRPNFLIIISDDQRYDTMEYMPRTRELIFERGIEFTSAYVTTPRCCPSRASILTGLYAHNHGVYTNDSPLREETSTFAEQLHESGYTTGIFGKYLNSYPIRESDPPRPEFDEWYVFPSDHPAYYDFKVNANGNIEEVKGYQTYALRDRAIAFLQTAAQQDKPFLLLFTPSAPHIPSDPAPGDENLYADQARARTPDYNEKDLSDKPEWLQSIYPLSPEDTEYMDGLWFDHIRSLNGLDIAVEDLIQELERQGELENTVIIYMSDNGIMLGEHRMLGKMLAYEPASHVPFAIYSSSLIKRPYTSHDLVANIDILPTLYELAGVHISRDVDGQSLVPLFGGDSRARWRDYLLIEGWPVDGSVARGQDVKVPFYQAIHTGQYVYIESTDDKSEFYDLSIDPYQLSSQIDNPEYAEIIADLRSKLEIERETIPPVKRSDLRNLSGD